MHVLIYMDVATDQEPAARLEIALFLEMKSIVYISGIACALVLGP
jgi:hypothetical protein